MCNMFDEKDIRNIEAESTDSASAMPTEDTFVEPRNILQELGILGVV